ncbi:TPA: hypothetical protein ACGOR8_002007 [Streptococcus suis]
MKYIRINNTLHSKASYEDIWNWHLSNNQDNFSAHEELRYTMLRYVEAVHPEQLDRMTEYEDLDNEFPFFTEEDYEALCKDERLEGNLEWLDSRYDQAAYLFENQFVLF